MLQYPKDKLNPVTPSPPPDQLRTAHSCTQTPQIDSILPGFIHDHQGHFSIGGARGPQPHVAYPWLPGVIPPGPLALDQVVPCDPSPVGEGKAVRGLPFHQQGPLMLLADMPHQLRVAKPTIASDDRRG